MKKLKTGDRSIVMDCPPIGINNFYDNFSNPTGKQTTTDFSAVDKANQGTRITAVNHFVSEVIQSGAEADSRRKPTLTEEYFAFFLKTINSLAAAKSEAA